MSKVTTNTRVEYSEALLQEILLKVADGESLASVCRKDGFPSRKTFFAWVSDKPSIAEQYQVALSMRAELFADEIIEIADDSGFDIKLDKDGNGRVDTENVQRAKLRVDSRKWIVSRLLPKKYGDKVEVDNKHSGIIAVTLTETDEKL